MGMKNRQKQRELRRSKKRARKEQNAARYAAWREAGTNGKKSKRIVRKHKCRWQRPVRTVRHRLGPCGNVGCDKCNPS